MNRTLFHNLCLPMRGTCMVILLTILCAGVLFSQEMATPTSTQIPLFMKILSFDRNLKSRVGSEIVIGVVYQSKFRSSYNTQTEFIGLMLDPSFRKVENLPVRCVSLDLDEDSNFDSTLVNESVDMLYISPLRTIEMKDLIAHTREKHLLTFTGVPEYVENGITVGIGTKGEKPEVLINLTAAKTEGVDFNSQLLKLAKIIQ